MLGVRGATCTRKACNRGLWSDSHRRIRVYKTRPIAADAQRQSKWSLQPALPRRLQFTKLLLCSLSYEGDGVRGQLRSGDLLRERQACDWATPRGRDWRSGQDRLAASTFARWRSL